MERERMSGETKSGESMICCVPHLSFSMPQGLIFEDYDL
jgi:hypothetical protein